MLEKIEIGKTYLDSNGFKSEILAIGNKSIFARSEDMSEGSCKINWAKDNWSELPREKEKWFEVICFHKENQRPVRKATFFKSEEDFLNYCDFKKEDYHWISLKEFKVE